MEEETHYIDSGWYLKHLILQIQNLDTQSVNVTYSLEQQDSNSGKWVSQEKTFKLEARETKKIDLGGTVIDDTEKWRGAYNAADGTPIGSRIETPIRNFKIKSVTPQVVDEVASSGNSTNNSVQKGMAYGSGNETLKLDKWGLVEDPIMDPELRQRIQEELAAAAKTRDAQEEKKEDEFNRIHKQKVDEWRENMRAGRSSYEEHPDVKMMSLLSGTDGILVGPETAREYDKKMMDAGWYPYLRPDEYYNERLNRFNTKYEASKRSNFSSKVDRPEGIPNDVKIPSFQSIREHFLNGQGK